MTSRIDKFMVNLGFAKSDIRRARYRRVLYVGIAVMAGLAVLGLALNLGVAA